MSFLNRIRSLVRRNQLDRDMAEEMRFHLDERTDNHVTDGLSPDDARVAAHRKFGGVAQIQEKARDVRGLMWLESAWRDICYALRQLRKSPGFTVVVVLTLALGIGSTTAIFSVINTLILNPIPGPDSESLVQIGELKHYSGDANPSFAGLTPPPLAALEAAGDLFTEIAWHESVRLEHKVGDFTEVLSGQMVSPNLFTVLKVQPMFGRNFAAEDAIRFVDRVPESGGAIILSHAWWQSNFEGDQESLGQTIKLGGRDFTIIGVMPPYFEFPAAYYKFWIPTESPRPRPDTIHMANILTVARLKPGVDERKIQPVLDTIARRLMNDYPPTERLTTYSSLWRSSSSPDGLTLWSRPLRQAIEHGTYVPSGPLGAMHRTLFGLLAAIGFVLAIVCTNVANLCVARTEQRQQELAVRVALGAGRWRLMRQILTENVLLACFGGLAGLVVTHWGVKLLVTFNAMPRLRPVEANGIVLLIAVLVSLLTGLAFGLVPALRAGRTRVFAAFKEGGNAAPGITSRNHLRNALVAVQVALALVLLTGAGLMIESVVHLLRVNPGFDPEGLLYVDLDLARGVQEMARRNQSRADISDWLHMRCDQIHERLAALPSVTAIGFSNRHNPRDFWIDSPTEPVEVWPFTTGLDDRDFTRAIRVPLLAGRHLNRNDVGTNIHTVVVNETLARAFWGGENAVGKTFKRTDRNGPIVYEVVGVIGDVHSYSYDERIRPALYRPFQDDEFRASNLIRFTVRTNVDPSGLVPQIREQLISLAPSMRMPDFFVVEDLFYDNSRTQRAYRNHLVALAAVGLALAALGIYGVLAYSVARRTKEIGIRMAVGAESRHVLRLIITDGARLIVVGVVLGLVAAFWLTRYLQSQLFEVSPTDPGVIASVVLVLLAVALLACYLPARRAAKVDPVIALRAE